MRPFFARCVCVITLMGLTLTAGAAMPAAQAASSAQLTRASTPAPTAQRARPAAPEPLDPTVSAGGVSTSVAPAATPLSGTIGADDYPDRDATDCSATFGIYSWCKNGSWLSPRRFAYRNCTDFVAWRLGITWGSLAFPGGDGNARGWRQGAINSGYAVGSAPVVGAVAWWGTEVGGGYGHVGVVMSVNGDGSANIEQYNKGGTGTYSPSFNQRADAYLYINVAPPGQGTGDGAFVRVNETGEVYRMAGGAPLYVSSWNGFGGSQPVAAISQAQLNGMPAYPRDGTFLNTTSGGVYRVAGGAPEAVSTWSSFGGVQPYVTIDQAAVDNAGAGGPWSHLRPLPMDGTFISNTADGRVYRVAGGAPLYISTYVPFGPGAAAATTSLDPWEFANYSHLRPVPGDIFVTGLPSGRVFHIVSGGHPYYVASWDPYGGAQPVSVAVDDWALDNCDHLACDPFGNYEALAPTPGGAVAAGWVMDPNTTSPVTVQIVADGVTVTSTLASASRGDVDAVYHRGANYGFTKQVTLPSGSHQLCLTALNIGPGPADTSLGCKTVSVTAGTMVGLSPTRLLDTRQSVQGISNGSPVAPGGTVLLPVLGRGGVPGSGVSAVMLNVTATSASAPGYLTAYPSGTGRPGSSTVNFSAGQSVPNLAVVGVGSDGKVAITNGGTGTVHVVADVTGYVVGGLATAAGATTVLRPARIIDTRAGLGVPVGGLTTVRVPVLGLGSVPASGVAAVLLNVTALSASSPGYLTAYPSGGARPPVSNLNFQSAAAIANLVVVPIGADGAVAFYNGSPSPVHVLADVAGYVLAGTAAEPGSTIAVGASRLLDTRTGNGSPAGAIAAAGVLHLGVLGRGPVPPRGVSAVLVNVTAIGPTAPGFVTVYPDGGTAPTASNVNFATRQTVGNLVLVPVGANGSIALRNGSSRPVDLVADVIGYTHA